MNAERLLAHFERIAEAPDAILRLRRLIFALGVRGRLVEQNDGDGRATQFDKSVDPHPDPPFSIPASWRWARLHKLGSLKGGGTPSKAQEEFWKGDIPWVSPKDMKLDYVADTQLQISHRAISGSAASMIEPGSLLFVVRGMILAHSFPVAIARVHLTINQDMKALVLHEPEMGEYLLRALKGLRTEMLKRVKTSTHGTRRIDGPGYRDLLIPVPPIPEQRRIVAKVDKLMALCDRLEAVRAEREKKRDRLTAASLVRLNTPDHDPAKFAGDARFAISILPTLTARPQQIQQLRQTILALAMHGRLVRQDGGAEPASQLLTKIRSPESRRACGTRLDEWLARCSGWHVSDSARLDLGSTGRHCRESDSRVCGSHEGPVCSNWRPVFAKPERAAQSI
jgi:type I restriction enzyme S subunit